MREIYGVCCLDGLRWYDTYVKFLVILIQASKPIKDITTMICEAAVTVLLITVIYEACC
jgi:hypothetical protein